MNKRALSPLVATVMLVVFALLVGTLTMSWANATVKLPEDIPSTVTVTLYHIDTPLKQLQLDYLSGKITLDQYLERERTILQN